MEILVYFQFFAHAFPLPCIVDDFEQGSLIVRFWLIANYYAPAVLQCSGFDRLFDALNIFFINRNNDCPGM